MMANINIREVTETDYDAVMAIRRPEEVFYGFDYLPDYFMMILKTPGYKGFAAVINGKIVAFEFACIIDGGKTLITRAARVSKEHSGKGPMQALENYVLNYYLQFPDVLYSVSSLNDERYSKRVHLQVKEGKRRLVHQRANLAFRGSIQDINNILMKIEIPTEVKEVTRTDFSEIFNSPNCCRKLFPDERLMVDWVPYCPLESNIPYIFTERNSVFGSNIGAMDPTKILLTFGNFMVCQSGILYNFDVYGSNIEALPGHLITHLKTLRKMPHDLLQLEIFCNDSIDKTHCVAATKDIGLTHYDSFQYKKGFCIESILKEEMVLNDSHKNRELHKTKL